MRALPVSLPVYILRRMKPVPFPRRHRAFACLLCGTLLAALCTFGSTQAWAAPKRPKKDTAAPVVEHTPVTTHDGKGPVVISARITDDSAIFEPTLVVRAASGAGAAFMRVPLVKGEADSYSAEVPAALLAGDVEYLVEAFDENGNGPSRVGDESAPLKIVRDVPPVAASVTPAADATAKSPAVPEDEGNTGLIVAGVVVGAIVVVGAAAGIGFAVYALRPPQPDAVQINVTGPSPIAGAL